MTYSQWKGHTVGDIEKQSPAGFDLDDLAHVYLEDKPLGPEESFKSDHWDQKGEDTLDSTELPSDDPPPRRPSVLSAAGSMASESLQRVLLALLEKRITMRQKSVESAAETNPHLYHRSHQFAWFTQVMFTLATLLLFALWVRHDHEEAFVGTFLVNTVAAAAYFAKATGFGDISISGVRIPLIRYVDWICTTPLMLYELCHIGHAEPHVTMMIIGCDILMLVFGIAAALIDRKYFQLKYFWFILSCFFYLVMLTTLHVDVAHGSALKQPKEVQTLFVQLEVLTVVVWSFYPLAVLFGRAHANLYSLAAENAMLCVLDMLSKIGMEWLIVWHCTFYLYSGDEGGGH